MRISLGALLPERGTIAVMEKEGKWDVAVIGGGPAGMMAAARAAELGAQVILIEKNDTLGKKLLITGGGRCNITNAEFDTRALLAKYAGASKYLFSAFSQWNVPETLEFFHSRSLPTKVENEKRVFPITDSARSVWQVLVNELAVQGVTIRSNSPVAGIITSTKDSNRVQGVQLANGEKIFASNVIIATGGTSRPETGSTGDGFAWLRALGHDVAEPAPSLVPLAARDPWVRRLAGVSLSDIKITVYQDGEKQASKKGKVLFTHVGLSGPTVLNMSRDIGELLKYGDVVVSLDVAPTLDYGMLDARLIETLAGSNKLFKNSLAGLVPSPLAPVIVELSGIAPDKQSNSVTREERIALGKLIKSIPITISGLLGTDKAIISSGGVSLDDVDFKTMQSRKYENLYLAGDILDINRPSGGYSLQLCWTTGFVAGTHAAKNSK